MTTNPHLDMANDVFNRMFGLPIIVPPEPIDAEGSEGICALSELSPAQLAEGDITSERL